MLLNLKIMDRQEEANDLINKSSRFYKRFGIRERG